MKKVLAILIVSFSFIFGNETKAQVTCDSIAGICSQYLKEGADNCVYISDGQVYRAFLQDEEAAEFTTTFFGGSTYRIAASAGKRKDYLIFEIRDEQDNLLFTNADHGNAPYWDFKVTSTMECKIETKLDPDKKSSGCAIMLIGFQKRM